MTGVGVPSHWRWICRVVWLNWVELVTCGACNTSNRQIGDVFAKKIGGNPRLNPTTYTVHAPSSIERLRRSSYRHSLEQATVARYRAAPSRVLCLVRPDCMFFTSICFEVDGGFFILWQVLVSLPTDVGFAELFDWIGLNLWLVVLATLAIVK